MSRNHRSTRQQEDRHAILARMTPLGREIMAIMARLERNHGWTYCQNLIPAPAEKQPPKKPVRTHRPEPEKRVRLLMELATKRRA